MKSNKKNSAFSAGIGYTISNILVRAVGFLTLPLFSRLMTTEEFGIYNVFTSYEAVLFVIIGLALHSSVQSANVEFRGKINDYVSSVSLIYLLNLLLFLVISVLFRNTLAEWLSIKPFLIYALVVYSFGVALLSLYNTWISLQYAYKQYLLVALINAIGNVVLSYVLIMTVFREQKDVGKILGTTLIVAMIAVYVLLTIFRKAKPRVNLEYWKFGLKYSLPIVPHGISQVLLGQFDRIMIQRMISSAAAGIYSLAGNVVLVLSVITGSVSTVWNTWFYKEMDKQNRQEIRKRAVQLTALFAILTIGVLALTPELILVLGGKKYEMAKQVAIPLVINGFVMFLYNVVSSGEYYMKKTVYIMYGTMAAAILNVVLNYIFIQKYGFVAAAYTTLFSYGCYLLFHLIICRKFLGFCIIPIKWIAIFGAIVAGAAIIDLLFLENILIRWGACALIVIPMAVLLLKNAGGVFSLLKGK